MNPEYQPGLCDYFTSSPLPAFRGLDIDDKDIYCNSTIYSVSIDNPELGYFNDKSFVEGVYSGNSPELPPIDPAPDKPISTNYLSSLNLTGSDYGKVFQEIIGLLPIIISVMISFVAIRKGIAFLKGTSHSA